MNPFRRSFLGLLATAGAAAVSAPPLARADRIRILPDGGPAQAPPLPGQGSPELGRALGGLTLGSAARQGGLAVLWLLAKDPPSGAPLEILTLDESRARGALVVTERAQASVPDLIAENRGKAYVLLLAGEILIGGKQNRVLREDLLLPPGSGPRNIGVYCVEQGRWNEGRKDFDSLGSVVQPSVRSQVLRKAEQSRIWSGVAAAARSVEAPSQTGSYQAIYDKPEVRTHLEQATRSFDPPAAVGAAVFVGPSLAGVDAFHAPDLFAREWPSCCAPTRSTPTAPPGPGTSRPRGRAPRACCGRRHGSRAAGARARAPGSSSSSRWTAGAARPCCSKGRRSTWRSCERGPVGRLDRRARARMMRPHAEPRAGRARRFPRRGKEHDRRWRRNCPTSTGPRSAPRSSRPSTRCRRRAAGCSTSSGSWPITRGRSRPSPPGIPSCARGRST